MLWLLEQAHIIIKNCMFPHNYDEIYLANNYMLVSFDGGKTFKQMNESEKHVDNHAVAFKK